MGVINEASIGSQFSGFCGLTVNRLYECFKTLYKVSYIHTYTQVILWLCNSMMQIPFSHYLRIFALDCVQIFIDGL